MANAALEFRDRIIFVIIDVDMEENKAIMAMLDVDKENTTLPTVRLLEFAGDGKKVHTLEPTEEIESDKIVKFVRQFFDKHVKDEL